MSAASPLPGAATLGFSSTGDDVAVLWNSAVQGKTIIVTGGNVGLGFETARVLASIGADVVVTCRDEKKAKDTAAKLTELVPSGSICAMVMDLGSLASVRKFVDAFLATKKPLHVLVNNAGVMACRRMETSDGLEMQFGVNHIGHYLLTMRLWPVLAQSGTAKEPARIINLSSKGHWLFGPPSGILFDDLDGKKKYDQWERYGQSKLANVLFAKYLARRAKKEQVAIIAASLHPGFIMETQLAKHMDLYTWMVMLYHLICKPKRFWGVLREAQKNTAQGVATTLYTVLAPDVVSGAYYADCKVQSVQTHPLSDNEVLAERLVEVSEKIVGGTK